MAKKTVSFDLDKAISRIAKPSVFDRIVREIDATEIPTRYIQSVLIQYYDSTVVEIDGSDLTKPIPLTKSMKLENMDSVFKNMRDMKIFIATDVLEEDVNKMVEDFLGKYC